MARHKPTNSCYRTWAPCKANRCECNREVEIGDLPLFGPDMVITEWGSENLYFIHMGRHYFCKVH